MSKNIANPQTFFDTPLRQGFTLIELLVVVLIIGILAAVALPQYTKAVEKSRATEALLVGKSFLDASQRYFLETNKYPTSFEELDIDTPAGYTISGQYATSPKFKIELDGNNVTTPSMRVFRVDPAGASIKYYFWWDMSKNIRTCNTHTVTSPEPQICRALGGVLSTGETTVWLF